MFEEEWASLVRLWDVLVILCTKDPVTMGLFFGCAGALWAAVMLWMHRERVEYLYRKHQMARSRRRRARMDPEQREYLSAEITRLAHQAARQYDALGDNDPVNETAVAKATARVFKTAHRQREELFYALLNETANQLEAVTGTDGEIERFGTLLCESFDGSPQLRRALQAFQGR